MQLTGALLCLHLTFLLCSHWVWLLKTVAEDWVCSALGLLLHWSFLATFSWIALEGFHLYLLLARVFNIYIRRYLLKLSLVGWGEWILSNVSCIRFFSLTIVLFYVLRAIMLKSGSRTRQMRHQPSVVWLLSFRLQHVIGYFHNCSIEFSLKEFYWHK